MDNRMQLVHIPIFYNIAIKLPATYLVPVFIQDAQQNSCIDEFLTSISIKTRHMHVGIFLLIK